MCACITITLSCVYAGDRDASSCLFLKYPMLGTSEEACAAGSRDHAADAGIALVRY